MFKDTCAFKTCAKGITKHNVYLKCDKPTSWSKFSLTNEYGIISNFVMGCCEIKDLKA